MHHAAWGLFEAALFGLSIIALLAYLAAAFAQRLTRKGWNHWRTMSFSGGILLLLTALWPDAVAFAHHDLRGHMAQHLLLGMLAPLGLVFGAPVTLALRSVPHGIGRKLVMFLRSPWMRCVSRPEIAMLLNIGGMYLLYLTPLYAAMHTNAALHALVHWHFLAAGCLFTWAIAGPDPAPRRPGKGFRLLVVFLSMAAHAFLSKAMYAYGWPTGTHHSLAEIRAGAQIMYYGGDFAELLLVVALFAQGLGRKAVAPRHSRSAVGAAASC